MCYGEDMNKPMVPFQLFRDLSDMIDVLDTDDGFGAKMAYEIAVDLCDGMFKGAGSMEEIRSIYARYIAALEDNAKTASFPGEREAYLDIITYVRDAAGMPA